MRSSQGAIMNIYQREALKPIEHRYSPAYRRNQSANIRIVLKNQDLKRATGKVIKKEQKNRQILNGMKESKVYASQHNPELIASSPLHPDQPKTTQDHHRQSSHRSNGQVFRSPSQQRDYQFKQAKATINRLRTQEREFVLQQIQYKKHEMQRQKVVKLQRKSSQRSFVLEAHKETIDMLKKSRRVRTRSQVKLVKDKYRETERQHDFLVVIKKTTNLQQHYEKKYSQAFLKNMPLSPQKYPNLADTLAIVSKTLNENRKGFQSREFTKKKLKSKPRIELPEEKEKKTYPKPETQLKEEKDKVETACISTEVQTFLTASDPNPLPNKNQSQKLPSNPDPVQPNSVSSADPNHTLPTDPKPAESPKIQSFE